MEVFDNRGMGTPRWTVKSVRVTDKSRGSECINGANGLSDIEGKAARGAASKCGQRASFNGVRGAEDMDAKPEG